MQRNPLALLASNAHLFPARKVSTSAVSALRFTRPSRLMRPRFEATRSGKHLPFGPRETWENKLPCLPPVQWITVNGAENKAKGEKSSLRESSRVCTLASFDHQSHFVPRPTPEFPPAAALDAYSLFSLETHKGSKQTSPSLPATFFSQQILKKA